ncbi:MAG: FAD:protein FMN transferase [Paraglaciecola sp.]|nr:FAD:protein FMN transferase [Paraglaciecola sp.]NCT49227.1 FAD:protein FMN transferase [Paraglaciecola sp.]
MASPCEILIDTQDLHLAEHLTALAYAEAKRIEYKYSRYIAGNPVDVINRSQGTPVGIDEETWRLLQFAQTCFELSDGMFDISSGVLRRAWRFDGSDKLPSAQLVAQLLPLVGWQKVRFDASSITLPTGMELDFGGIGKEYAVDCVAKLLTQNTVDTSVVVNFGGDIQVTQPRQHGQRWQIGIESLQGYQYIAKLLSIHSGGLATSGDARRYLLKDGVRYSHILNPKTGYPVRDAPRSITVAADHCVQAGLLATLALLQGAAAEDFLAKQHVKYWSFRHTDHHAQ